MDKAANVKNVKIMVKIMDKGMEKATEVVWPKSQQTKWASQDKFHKE